MLIFRKASDPEVSGESTMSVPFGMANSMPHPRVREAGWRVGQAHQKRAGHCSLEPAVAEAEVESALKAELDEYLGDERHAPAGRGSGNSRNGHSSKTLKGDLGEIPLQTPRDRNGTFEPLIQRPNPVGPPGQSNSGLVRQGDDHARHRRYPSGTLRNRGLDSAGRQVTDAVWDTVQTWQSRPLDWANLDYAARLGLGQERLHHRRLGHRQMCPPPSAARPSRQHRLILLEKRRMHFADRAFAQTRFGRNHRVAFPERRPQMHA